MLDILTCTTISLLVRQAVDEDRAEIDALRQSAISHLLDPLLPEAKRTAFHRYMPLDDRLIADGTYFVAEVSGVIAAAGGWSRRAALVRGAARQQDPDRLLDPSAEPAIIRAMYTHPDFARRGLGSLLLSTSETAARLAGFRSAKVIATPAGEKLFLASGWHIEERLELGESGAPTAPVSLMSRSLH
jgi:GNAT superfamily N-acetyltransferase